MDKIHTSLLNKAYDELLANTITLNENPQIQKIKDGCYCVNIGNLLTKLKMSRNDFLKYLRDASIQYEIDRDEIVHKDSMTPAQYKALLIECAEKMKM